MRGTVIRASVLLDTGIALSQVSGPGRQLRMRALPDHSSKAADCAHVIFKFESFADGHGQAIKLPGSEPRQTTIKGVVSALHFTLLSPTEI